MESTQIDWSAQVDIYCERLGPTFWAEPINAVTNLAFIIAAIFVMMRIRGDRAATVLALVIAMIGVGSGLFHTFATRWAAFADTSSILIYILIYVYHATQRVLGKDKAIALLSVFLFIPYAIITERALTASLGSLNGSVSYMPVLIMIVIYGAISNVAGVRRDFFIGAGILAVSIFFRTIDIAVCAALPIGTHFIWHILNAIMLAWMIFALHKVQPAVAKA